MKRFASHYIYIPSFGFLKQYVTEIDGNGYVTALYRLEEEAESIIWTPGVIGLLPRHNEGADWDDEPNKQLLFDITEVRSELPNEYVDCIKELQWTAVRLYPFDFTRMKPTADTMFQRLNDTMF